MQTQWAKIIPFIAATLLAAGAARAQDILIGKGIAQLWCSDCHLVDPQERKSGRDSAPTFLSIARKKSTTEASLAAFLSTPHGRGGMPDLVLNRTEIQEVSPTSSAYASCLSRTKLLNSTCTTSAHTSMARGAPGVDEDPARQRRDAGGRESGVNEREVLLEALEWARGTFACSPAATPCSN
jgi:hypothetical protein